MFSEESLERLIAVPVVDHDVVRIDVDDAVHVPSVVPFYRRCETGTRLAKQLDNAHDLWENPEPKRIQSLPFVASRALRGSDLARAGGLQFQH